MGRGYSAGGIKIIDNGLGIVDRYVLIFPRLFDFAEDRGDFPTQNTEAVTLCRGIKHTFQAELEMKVRSLSPLA